MDGFVHPWNSQSINPYSYIMNNPLAGTDPSGYLCSTGSRLGGDQGGCRVGTFDAGNPAIQRNRRKLETSSLESKNGEIYNGAKLFGDGRLGEAAKGGGSYGGGSAAIDDFGSTKSDASDSPGSGSNGLPDGGGVKDGSQTDDGILRKISPKLTDLVPPVNGVLVGRLPNGQRLTDAQIRLGVSKAEAALVNARRSGTGRGSTIGTAVILEKNGVTITKPNTRTTDGLVPLESGGGYGATSAASVGANFLVILLQDGVDNSPSSRGARSHLNDAFNASLVDNAGLPVILIAPSGSGNTGLMLEAIPNSKMGIDATVDEVMIR